MTAIPSVRPRKRLWELEHRFHCCLTLTELRKLCIKSRFKIPVLERDTDRAGALDLDGGGRLYLDGRHRLWPSFLIVRPLDQVSHDAVHRLKRECKRQGRRFLPLPRASLSAVARRRHELTAQDVPLCA